MNKFSSKKAILYFHNFSFSYHKKSSVNKALKNINLKIYPYTVTAIIGPSGCGKTTFLKAINRIHELKYDSIKTEGNIFFQNQPIYDKKNKLNRLRKKIGLVFQKPAPFPISIRDNLLFAPKIHGLTKVQDYDALVEKSLKQTNLWEEVKNSLDDSALQLSGGQQQRLCLARCLANEPEIILMDEPTSSLDPISREKIENLIMTLKTKYTIILVTHSLNQASRISDNVVFLDKGEIIESGKTKHIFTEPQKEKTQDYINGNFD